MWLDFAAAYSEPCPLPLKIVDPFPGVRAFGAISRMPSMAEQISAAVVRRQKGKVARTKRPWQAQSGLEQAAFLRS